MPLLTPDLKSKKVLTLLLAIFDQNHHKFAQNTFQGITHKYDFTLASSLFAASSALKPPQRSLKLTVKGSD